MAAITLSIDDTLLKKGQAFAESQKASLDHLFEKYLREKTELSLPSH